MGANEPDISNEAVENATGRTWDEWRALIDGWGGKDLGHKEIVARVRDDAGIESPWWQQAVTVGYEKLSGQRVTGETAEGDFQVGVRRTVDFPSEQAWELLGSAEGVAAWLGRAPGLELEEGDRYATEAGAEGEVRVVSGTHVRLTWHPQGWPRPSTVQVRVQPRGDRCVISFHQEKIPDAEAREARRAHFRAALDRLEELAGG